MTVEIPIDDEFPLIDKDGFFVVPPALREEDDEGPACKVIELENTLTRPGPAEPETAPRVEPAPTPVTPEPDIEPAIEPAMERTPAPAVDPRPEPAPPTPVVEVEPEPAPPTPVVEVVPEPAPPTPVVEVVPDLDPPTPVVEVVPDLDPEEDTDLEIEESSPAKDPEAILGRRHASADDEAWLAGVGISERHEREQELGAGKWTEPARSLEEVAASMPSDPIREMRVRPSGIPYKLLLIAAILAAVLAWLVLRDGSGDPEPTPLGPSQSAQKAIGTTPAAESAAASDAPVVTVWTDLDGARIELDGRDQGPAPTRVPVPLDTELHELCLVLGEMRRCQELTGEQLAARDPYAFTVGDTP